MPMPEWQELTASHGNLVDWLACAEKPASLKARTWAKVREMVATA